MVERALRQVSSKEDISLQRNLSNPDTLGAEESVLISEVS